MSAAIEGVIAAFLALIAYTQEKQFILQKTQSGIQVTDSATGKNLVTIPTVLKLITSFSVFGKRISTQNPVTSLDVDNPNFKFTYADVDMELLALSFVPDSNFKTLGQLRIVINGSRVFPPIVTNSSTEFSDAGFFTDLTVFSLPIPPQGIALERSKSISIFIATSDITKTVNLTLAGLVAIPQ